MTNYDIQGSLSRTLLVQPRWEIESKEENQEIETGKKCA